LKIIKNELNGRNGPGEVVHTQHLMQVNSLGNQIAVNS